MQEFWEGLSLMRQVFFCLAIFFSLIFAWQFIMALIGLTADADFDASETSHTAGDSADHAGEGTMIAFKLFSIRSIVAFLLLFSWAGFLFLADEGSIHFSYIKAMLYSALWGIVAMVLVSWLFWQLLRMQETGNASIQTSLNTHGEVYMDIKDGKLGQVRIMMSGRLCCVAARSANNENLPAGTKVLVKKIIDAKTVEVVKL